MADAEDGVVGQHHGPAASGMTDEQARAALSLVWRQIRADEIGPAISEQQKRNLATAELAVEPGDKGFGQLRRSDRSRS